MIKGKYSGGTSSIFIAILIYFFSGTCIAEVIYKKGICNLDRTVESLFDLKTWLSAKSRASSDWIPVKYNNNILYLGAGGDKYIYVRRENKKLQNGVEYILYDRTSDGSIIMISSNQDGTIAIFGKTDAGPYFFGSCGIS